MLKVLVAFFVLFILSVSSEDEESFSYRRMMYVSHLSVVFLSHPSSLPCFSETAWDGLEKPVGTLEGQSFAQCWQKCSDLGENCGLFHSHRGLQTCTPAKVGLETSHWSTSLHRYSALIAHTSGKENAPTRDILRLSLCCYGLMIGQ